MEETTFKQNRPTKTYKNENKSHNNWQNASMELKKSSGKSFAFKRTIQMFIEFRTKFKRKNTFFIGTLKGNSTTVKENIRRIS